MDITDNNLSDDLNTILPPIGQEEQSIITKLEIDTILLLFLPLLLKIVVAIITNFSLVMSPMIILCARRHA